MNRAKTRIKDKNGVDICEGDIIHSNDWDWGPRYVRWDQGRCGPCEADSVGSYVLAHPAKPSIHNEWNGIEVEVIGNIHDNPKLIQNYKGVLNNV
jgi:hypothetical protein